MEYPSLSTPPAGSIRFNTDSFKLEIYNGDKWWEMDSISLREQTAGTRGFFSGGLNPSLTDTINYVNVSSTGDATDFGNLTQAGRLCAMGSSRTRAVRAGGISPSPNGENVIDYMTIATGGTGVDFGDLNYSSRAGSGLSNAHGGL